jgi:RNase H-fold protein (predicted Holliday junction resolvase)
MSYASPNVKKLLLKVYFQELGEAKQKSIDAESKLAEERLAVVEARRQLEEEIQKFNREKEQKQKQDQNVILGKKNAIGQKARGRISFGIKTKQ